MRAVVLLASVSALHLTRCDFSLHPQSYGEVPGRSVQRSQFLWQRYRERIFSQHAPADFQDNCAPAWVAARGDPKGIVLLLHGWGPCPHEMLQLAHAASESGFTALVPALPGAGLRLSTLREKDPYPLSKNEYYSFLREMTEIVTSHPGEAAVAGTSFGASLALLAASLAQGTPSNGTYQRLLLLDPLSPTMLVSAGRMVGQELQNLAHSVLIRTRQHSCEQAQQMGFPGYCQEEQKSSLSGGVVLDLSEEAYKLIKGHPPLTLATQVVYTQDTGYQNWLVNARDAHLYAASACQVPIKFHCFLDPYRNAAQSNLFWLPELPCRLASFLTQNQHPKMLSPSSPSSTCHFLPHSLQASSSEEMVPMCEFECTESTCTYELVNHEQSLKQSDWNMCGSLQGSNVEGAQQIV